MICHCSLLSFHLTLYYVPTCASASFFDRCSYHHRRRHSLHDVLLPSLTYRRHHYCAINALSLLQLVTLPSPLFPLRYFPPPLAPTFLWLLADRSLPLCFIALRVCSLRGWSCLLPPPLHSLLFLVSLKLWWWWAGLGGSPTMAGEQKSWDFVSLFRKRVF